MSNGNGHSLFMNVKPDSVSRPQSHACKSIYFQETPTLSSQFPDFLFTLIYYTLGWKKS